MKNWRGWAAIGAILMVVAGVFQIISGIWGLFNDQWIILGYNGYFITDVTGLAVWMLVIGVILVLGGIAVMQGSTLGRIVGIVAASLAIISQLFMLPVHPIWSILLIALYVLALIGFVVVRGPLEPTEEQLVAAAEAAPVVPEAAPVVAVPPAPAAPEAAPVAPAPVVPPPAPTQAEPVVFVEEKPVPPIEPVE